ncbi:leucine-rich repeat neuronal protein 4 [Elgaria multicarinata webbii]|uniref:leucine-rich repeat neuronal protein 4 n=1 Tax=Elgaria multicarinata webbii TaxID=159646 RepID=UPI002FCD002B
MFCLFLAYLVLLGGEVPARPIEETGPVARGDVKGIFQLLKQNVWEENVKLTNLSCGEQSNQTWTILSLKNQSLASFPACLPESLAHLDLSNNLLPQLHGQDVAFLPKLQVLTLRHNQIQQVTWTTGSLSSLQVLDLSFNLLSSVPACSASTCLDNLKWLSLAGNPITEVQPLAFSCYPQLHFLNLSSTWLGKDSKEAIRESAFATDFLHVGDSTKSAGNVLTVLDLSATFLERIHQDWIKDLPRLTSLYLTRMNRLRSLDADAFLHVPKLKELDCRDSHALSLVKTEAFSHTPHVASLIFQNCNLSSFTPWNLSSSSHLVINLYGNPLACHCAISWLLANSDQIILQRVSETTCYPSPEERIGSVSGPMLLSELYEECKTWRIAHSTPALTLGELYSTSSSFATDTLSDSSVLPHEWGSSSFAPQSTHLTWEDTTKQSPTKAGILVYKKEAVYGSADHPPSLAAVSTTSSTVLQKLSTEQTLVSTMEMDQGKQDATTVNSIVSPEGTLLHFALLSPTTEATELNSSQVSSGWFSPHSTAHSDETTPPLQKPTKALSLPSLGTTNHPMYYKDDYDYEKEQEESIMKIVGLCDYDPCRHLQKPCPDLQALSPCLCPGITDEFTVPEPPRLRKVSEMRDTSAEIHWCAPSSVVRFYQLAYRPKGSKKNYTISGEIYATARRYTLNNLLPSSTYQVCIIASNKAGSSQATEQNARNAPCSTFATQSSYKPVLAALCATSVLFLISTILLSVCLCKKCRAPHTEQYSTHLVSYKNPAFDYSLK